MIGSSYKLCWSAEGKLQVYPIKNLRILYEGRYRNDVTAVLYWQWCYLNLKSDQIKPAACLHEVCGAVRCHARFVANSQVRMSCER